MAPSTKGNGGESLGAKDTGRVSWTKDTVYIFIDLCNQYMERSRGKSGVKTSQRLSWKKLAEQFQKRTNLPWDKNKLKSKYDWMRARWILWKQLKGRETDLAWDHDKGTISANDEWWEKKLKDNNYFKAFRDEGIEPSMEKKLDLLFEYSSFGEAGKHAPPEHLPFQTQHHEFQHGGELVCVPSPHTSNSHDPPLREESIGHNDFRADCACEEIPKKAIPISTYNGMATPNEANHGRRYKRKLDSDDHSQSSKSARNDSTSETGGMEMLVEKLDNILESISSRNNLMAKFLQSMCDANAPNLSSSNEVRGVMSVGDAVSKLCTLDGLVPGSPEFSFAVMMIEDPQKREILGRMPSDIAIVAWIKFMYAERKRK